jgi:hypothetical protein
MRLVRTAAAAGVITSFVILRRIYIEVKADLTPQSIDIISLPNFLRLTILSVSVIVVQSR